MINNTDILNEYNILANLTNETYANHIMMNSLKMLGSKKAISKDVLESKDYKIINDYKYPDRLIKMMNFNSQRFIAEGTFGVSFTKIALMQSHDITF